MKKIPLMILCLSTGYLGGALYSVYNQTTDLNMFYGKVLITFVGILISTILLVAESIKNDN